MLLVVLEHSVQTRSFEVGLPCSVELLLVVPSMLREPLAQALSCLRDSRTKLSDCITLEGGGPFKDSVALPID